MTVIYYKTGPKNEFFQVSIPKMSDYAGVKQKEHRLSVIERFSTIGKNSQKTIFSLNLRAIWYIKLMVKCVHVPVFHLGNFDFQ